ncbi:MAG: metallophosphoesterase [Gemmataceae bacterium]
MKKVLLASIALGLVLAAMALSGGVSGPSSDLQIDVQDRNPWTHLRLNNDFDTFHFAIVSDRTGGHRARVFSMAVDQLNLLQPSFVLSVGDLIEGYTKDKGRLGEQWKEMQGYVARLQMPFFYVPGNHDVANLTEAEEWKGRFGRSYYHFLYKNVLFLCLNSSDPAEEKAEIRFSKEQIDYVAKVLRENDKARWTVVCLHKPVWVMKDLEKSGWLDIEDLLKGRNYTVFAGHLHHYRKFVRNGMNYYMLATTGGASRMRGLRYSEFDHIVWVTMKKEGPTLANILLDGVYPEDLKKSYTDEDAYVRHNTKPPQPTRGTVLLDGVPVADAEVALYAVDAAVVKKETKKEEIDKKVIEVAKRLPPRVADALTEADGTFTLSSYAAGDGAPAGTYTVTVVRRVPAYEPSGKPGPNRLPARYATPHESPLRVTVKAGDNVLDLRLTAP